LLHRAEKSLLDNRGFEGTTMFPLVFLVKELLVLGTLT
jgi:hypothetical protein